MKKYNIIELSNIIAESFSIAEVLRKLEIVPAGGNYRTIKNQIKKENIDTSHFTGKGWLKGKRNAHAKSIPLNEILVADCYYQTSKLKKRLFQEGIFEKKCDCCKRKEWEGQPIPLELDHINGQNFDNRLENLRVLCPNCHALTNTYRGKNKKCPYKIAEKSKEKISIEPNYNVSDSAVRKRYKRLQNENIN
jgi:hypothetical protein